MTRQLSVAAARYSSINHISPFVGAVLVAIIICGLSVRAADLAEQAHSLKKVPADAAFYSASLRMKEQWEMFRGSKAYGKLMEIPLVQLAKMQISFQWQQNNTPAIAKVREYFESPAGQDAVGVLKEMGSEEVFAYGGNNIADWINLVSEAGSLDRKFRIEAKTEDKGQREADPGKVLEALSKRISSGMTVPEVVIGFRAKDLERAKREINEIHSLLRGVLDEHVPDLAAHLQREKIAGGEFLTLRMDGSMIPWDVVKEKAENDDQFKAIRDALSKKTAVIALGVTDEFVLFSIGATTEHLDALGKGATLASQPGLKPLEKHAGERVVSISYLSKTFAQSLGSAQKMKNNIADATEEAMVQAKVDEEDRKTILDDIRAFDLAKYMPEPAEVAGIAYLTSRGYEAFQYSSGKRPMMDGSKPLSILSHVGGNPLLLFASRSKNSVEDYTQLVDWLKRIAGHAEKIAEKKADSDDWDNYKEFRDKGIELLERLDNANREYLLPALADGQGALVLDFTAKSQKWFEKMPESPKPLPMLELGLVTGVSDREKFRAGVKAYIEVVRDGYKLAKEIKEDDMPELKMPKPNVTDLDGGGKLYTFGLPKKWGVDSQVAVNAGLTDKFAAISLMPATTQRLLSEKSPELDTSLKLDRPAAVVTHIECAKLIDSIRPWIDYGSDVATGKIKPKAEKEDGDTEEDDKKPQAPSPMMMQLGFVIPQVHQLLDVFSTMQSVTSMCYEEEGMWVTHSETRIQDLK